MQISSLQVGVAYEIAKAAFGWGHYRGRLRGVCSKIKDGYAVFQLDDGTSVRRSRDGIYMTWGEREKWDAENATQKAAYEALRSQKRPDLDVIRDAFEQNGVARNAVSCYELNDGSYSVSADPSATVSLPLSKWLALAAKLAR